MQGSAQKGFTLVEIAIVLVIIGLLLGGILRGQEMITQAKIKNVISDYTGISAAYHGYQDRYRAIPGDDPQAAVRWNGATISATAGEPGNGVVQGAWNSQANADESRMWWDHLRRAGFVAGNGYQQPFNAVAGMIGVQTGDAANGAVFGGFSGIIVCSANLPDRIAIATDTQMDDGQPATGTVRGLLQVGGPNPALPAGTLATSNLTGYQESGTNVYILCRAL
jgi:prepilin-type N-terminal cleavage/methylation domain-containing protein